MRQTTNYALNLPEGPDVYDVKDYNKNFDIIDEKMKELAKYIIPGENIDSINVVAELPVELIENAMYLIPIIEQLVPAIPNDTGYEKFIIVANVENALVNYSLANEFYLFAGSKLATRGSYPEDLTMGNANSQTAFSKIYRYIVGGDFEWAEYTDINWTNNVPIHKVTNVIFASENIVRNTVGTVMFAPDQNIIKSDGTYSDADFPSQYQTYYVLDGEAKKRGITDLSWILNNLLDIVKPITITENGTYTPDNFDVFGYGPVIVNIDGANIKLISQFDFTGESPNLDMVKNIILPSGMRLGMLGGTINSQNSYKFLGNYLNVGTVAKIEIKMGTFDRSIETENEYNTLFSLIKKSYKGSLWWDNTNNIWTIGSQAISNLTDKHYFENKTITIYFGARMIDGELYREYNGISYQNKFNIWADNTEIVEATEEADSSSLIKTAIIQIGTREADETPEAYWGAFVGAVFESVKIWQIFNKYETN